MLKKIFAPLATVFASVMLFIPALHAADAASPIKNCLPQNLQGDAKFDWQQFHGKVVYVDFWASWCGPCRESFPFMNELQKDFPNELVVLGVSVDAEKADAERFLAKTPAEFSLAIDTTGVCPKEFAVKGMPSTYILGPQGQLLFSHKGFRRSDTEKLREKVSEILKATAGSDQSAKVGSL